MDNHIKFENFTPIFTLIAKSEEELVETIARYNYKNAIYEIRVDALLYYNNTVDNVIYIINNVLSIFDDYKFLVTIRTKDEGGLVKLDYKE